MFFDLDDYWGPGSPAAEGIGGHLPNRYGFEQTSIHVAELAAAASALRWARSGAWNMLVSDRSSVFDVLKRVSEHGSSGLQKAACSPLEKRMFHLVTAFGDAWDGSAPPPSWRMNQTQHPSVWDARLPAEQDPSRLVWWCRIPFYKDGIVGVDIKSHQNGANRPYTAISHGNETQDTACNQWYGTPTPPDIKYPSGGLFAFASVQGYLVTGRPLETVRGILREQAHREWAHKPVQGKVARLCGAARPSLDTRSFAHCHVAEQWRCLRLASDTSKRVDLSGIHFRALRGIGGGWTELLHSDADLKELADKWSADAELDSVRLCPLCRQGAGTPRHVFMTCPDTWEHQCVVRDTLEQELAMDGAGQHLMDRAGEWWVEQASRNGGARRTEIPLETARRWPILSSWRWVVPCPSFEAAIRAADVHSSAPGVAMETALDLAYRGIVPSCLARAVEGVEPTAVSSASEAEEYAAQREHGGLAQESASRVISLNKHRRLKRICVILLLGIRKVRAAYAERIAAWRSLQMAASAQGMVLAVNEHSVPSERQAAGSHLPPRASSVLSWAQSQAGQADIVAMRWRILPLDAACNRLAQFAPGGARLGARASTEILSRLGVPTLVDGSVSCGAFWPEWQAVLSALQRRCDCVQGNANDSWLCSYCGNTRSHHLPSDRVMGVCRWCNISCNRICPSCGQGVHLTGECSRWLHGANRAYAPSATDVHFLCPDCLHCFASALQLSPRSLRRMRGPQSIVTHMQLLASQARPCAGIARSAPPRVRANTKAISMFIQWFLRGRAWTRLSVIQRALEHALRAVSQRAGSRVPIASRFCAAMERLVSQRRIIIDGHGCRRAARAVQRGVHTPARVSISHRARRRRRRGSPATTVVRQRLR